MLIGVVLGLVAGGGLVVEMWNGDLVEYGGPGNLWLIDGGVLVGGFLLSLLAPLTIGTATTGLAFGALVSAVIALFRDAGYALPLLGLLFACIIVGQAARTVVQERGGY